MSQILEKPELQLEKLWQIFDHCIKTNRFRQIKGKFSDGVNGRCVSGAIFNYISGIDPEDKRGSPAYTNVGDIATEKYCFQSTYFDGPVNPILQMSIANQVEYLKNYHKKTGVISRSIVQILNDEGVTFEQFRDLFKEMNV